MDKKLILVVDDDEIICRLTSRILADKYDVIIADSGKAAIELYEERHPDMILSDLLMPEMDGFEMVEILRKKEGFNIPVMYMTSLTGDEAEEKSLVAGAADYIRKPFKADVLLKRVENVMTNIEKISGLRRAAENDPMTGLLNKTTSTVVIDGVVRQGMGMLLMVDLDSFKLVNDIYGHDKGDQILIKFAEILKSVMRSTDIIGRVGGDEFIVFCQNTKDERMLEERTGFLNRKLLAFAKECLAEDMNIPLGCSIGAAMCPEDGNDFNTLYKKADEALYNAKQNGKHIYSIYKRAEEEKPEHRNEDFLEIRKILGERGEHRGAYVLPVDDLTVLYRFLLRVSSNYANDIRLVVFNFENDDGHVAEYIDKFVEVEASCLRGSDVITKFGENQVITILLKATEEDYMIPIERVMGKWKETEEAGKVTITTNSEKL